MSRPATPTMSVASKSGTNQSPTVTSPLPKPAVEAPSVPEICPWSSKAIYPPSRYREPWAMLTIRIKPNTSVKPLATMK